jgi:hypothetical protein
MTRALFWISLLLCVVVGGWHSFVGLASFEPLSPNLVWFIGAGFGVLFYAGLNVASWRSSPADRLVRRLTHAANVLMTGFAIVAIRAVPERQPYLALLAFSGLLIAGVLHDREQRETRPVDPATGH